MNAASPDEPMTHLEHKTWERRMSHFASLGQEGDLGQESQRYCLDLSK